MSSDSKFAVVTGISSGLGAAITKLLLAKDYIVFGGAKSPSSIDHDNLIESRLDVRSEESVVNFFDLVSETTSQIDLVVNNAGICELNNLENTTAQEFMDHMSVNALGLLLILKYGINYFRPAQTHIVNILSLTAKHSYPHALSYSASKHAMDAVINCVKKDWEKLNFRFSSLYSGAIDTPLWDKYENVTNREKMLSIDDFLYVFECTIDAPKNVQFEKLEFLSRDSLID